MLLVPLLAVGLLAGGFATPVLGSTASGKECCPATVVNSACCGLSCCQAPAPQPDRSATEHSKRTTDRSTDGKIAWASLFTLDRDHRQTAVGGRQFGVPASGSPSLIAQHVRLQI
jgi:hypothetical protein